MYKISTTEFKKHFGKYIDLAKSEAIQITKRGTIIFTIVPQIDMNIENAKSFFNMLPEDASIGNDPNERD